MHVEAGQFGLVDGDDRNGLDRGEYLLYGGMRSDDDVCGFLHHQREVAGEQNDVAEALLGVYQDRFAGDVLASPYWLRKDAAGGGEPGEIGQFPAPVILRPSVLHVALQQQDMGEVKVVFGGVGTERNRTSGGVCCLLRAVHGLECVAEVEVCARQRGVEGDGVLAELLGRRPGAELHHGASEGREDDGVLGLERDGGRACGQSLVVPSEIEQRGSEVGVCECVAGVEGDGMSGGGNGALPVPLLQ